MTDPVEGLRKVLALERQKQFSDNAVVGGLDRYLLNFVREAGIPPTHRFSGVLRALPPGGYRALHVLQRRRVVDELREQSSIERATVRVASEIAIAVHEVRIDLGKQREHQRRPLARRQLEDPDHVDQR